MMMTMMVTMVYLPNVLTVNYLQDDEEGDGGGGGDVDDDVDDDEDDTYCLMFFVN